MADYVSGFTVTLDHDMRVDDVEATRKAIAMVRGVITVQPLGGGALLMAEDRVKFQYHMAMHDAVRRVFDGTVPDKGYPRISPTTHAFLTNHYVWLALYLIALAVVLANAFLPVRIHVEFP